MLAYHNILLLFIPLKSVSKKLKNWGGVGNVRKPLPSIICSVHRGLWL